MSTSAQDLRGNTWIYRRAAVLFCHLEQNKTTLKKKKSAEWSLNGRKSKHTFSANIKWCTKSGMAPVEHHKSLHQQGAWNTDCVGILTENTEHIKHRKPNPSITTSFINIDNFPHICCNYDAVFFLHSNFKSVSLRIFELPLNVKAGW